MEERINNLKLAEKSARISIIAYIILSIVKLTIGYFAQSKALSADGLNNTTDILASIAVLIGLRISQKPADDNHPYGHSRAETIASLIASFIMVSVGMGVFYQGIESLFITDIKAPNLFSSIIALLSGVFMYAVYIYNKRIALQVNSSGLLAASKDNRSDAWISFGTAFGIIGAYFGLQFLDPLLAGIIGILIIKTGFDIFRESTHNLSDGFSKEELEEIQQSIYKVKGVKQVKDIKARRHGNSLLVDAIIGVNPDITVSEGHDITEIVEQDLKERYEIMDVLIHVEPEQVISHKK
jgi:cation diffusion facilitator family transporter